MCCMVMVYLCFITVRNLFLSFDLCVFLCCCTFLWVFSMARCVFNSSASNLFVYGFVVIVLEYTASNLYTSLCFRFLYVLCCSSCLCRFSRECVVLSTWLGFFICVAVCYMYFSQVKVAFSSVLSFHLVTTTMLISIFY